jgi:steroid 5-alpha reductase family enzyme
LKKFRLISLGGQQEKLAAERKQGCIPATTLRIKVNNRPEIGEMDPLVIFGNLGTALVVMIVVWLLSLKLRDASVVDVFWGLGIVLIAWLTFAQTGGFMGRRLLLAGLVSVWGLRLALHILWRRRGHGEDRRYAAMRAARGAAFGWQSLFTIFLLQGFLQWLISLGVQFGIASATPPHWTAWDLAGAALWAAGFLFETVGDAQLARFKRDPGNRGRVMDRGLWRYTRHPNYFGEAVMWWGLALMVLPTPYGPWTVLCPALMTFFLLRVSGVTLLEGDLVARRPGYRDYVARTSAFIPWPPRRKVRSGE